MRKKFSFPGAFKLILLFYILAALLVAGCSKNGVITPPSPNDLSITGSAYKPSSITISVNTTLKWTNNDKVNHSVTSDALLFDSGVIKPGASYSYQFLVPGTYYYHCTFHAAMHGTIVVY